MTERLRTRLRKVRDGVNAKLHAEREGMGMYGKGLQREGYEGGYLQALSDMMAFIDGWTDCNSRHQSLWERKP